MGYSDIQPIQMTLLDTPTPGRVLDAVEELSSSDESGRGAVFTRPEVVDFILDLIDYSPECPLHTKRLLEPSFGS